MVTLNNNIQIKSGLYQENEINQKCFKEKNMSSQYLTTFCHSHNPFPFLMTMILH